MRCGLSLLPSSSPWHTKKTVCRGIVGVCMDGKRAVRNVKDVLTVMLYMILCCVSWLTSYKVVCADER